MTATSHDQNFKNLILDYPRQALAFFAPSEAEGIDSATRITPIRQEQLKDRLGERFHELDVPLLVEWPDGRREALLFVLEEETSPARFSIHRLAHYSLELAELYDTGRIVPVVIFLRRHPRIPKSLQLGSERHTYLDFHYIACELATTPAVEYMESDNIVARLNLPNMQWRREQKIDIYAQAIRGLLQLEPKIDKQLKYVDFVDIYTALDDNERQQYIARYPKEDSNMAGLRERLLNEGIQQGRQEGRQEGEQTVLARLLAYRFGPLSPTVQQRLQTAAPDEIDHWIKNILDARNLEDVFRSH